MTALEQEIRRRGPAGTLPMDLRVDNYKWEFQPSTNKRKRGESTFRGTANTAEFTGGGSGDIRVHLGGYGVI